MASAGAGTGVRIDVSTVVGFLLALITFYGGARILLLIYGYLEPLYAFGIDATLYGTRQTVGLFVPGLALLALSIAFPAMMVSGRRSSAALVAVLAIALLYGYAGVGLAAAAVAVAVAYVVLDAVSRAGGTHVGRSRSG